MKNSIILTTFILMFFVFACRHNENELLSSRNSSISTLNNTTGVIDTILSDMGVTEVKCIDSITLNVKTNKSMMSSIIITDLPKLNNNSSFKVRNLTLDSIYVYNFGGSGNLEVTVFKDELSYSNNLKAYTITLSKDTDTSSGIELKSSSNNSLYLVSILDLIKTNGNTFNPPVSGGTPQSFVRRLGRGCKDQYACDSYLLSLATRVCSPDKVGYRSTNFWISPIDGTTGGSISFLCVGSYGPYNDK